MKGLFDNPIWNAGETPLINVEQPENEHPHARTARLASQLLTPFNIGSAVLTGGAGALVGKLPQIARALSAGAKGLSGLTTLHGGKELTTADTWPERIVGGLETIGGIFGMRQGLPKIAGKIDEVIPEKI